MAFIFYDFETTGLHKYFDQFLQFGAVYTDDNLNELDSLDIRCRRLPHVIPSPVAMRITRMRPADLEECDLSHYEATGIILDWCRSKGSCIFAGYNSMSFDEGFLRQALYQNLHEPYLSNTNGNARADILHIARGFFHHAPEILEVPAGAGGRFVLRLGPLARANGIALGEDVAHDASADVRATVELAKLMKLGSPKLWEILIGQARRQGVDDFLAVEDVFQASFFFEDRPFSYVMTEAARNNDDDKDIGLFDLTHDPSQYISLSRDELVDVLNMSPKVIRPIRSNSQPTLVPLDRPSNHLRGTVPSEDVLLDRARTIREATDFQQRLAEALPLRYDPREPSEHVEERIYDGFPDDTDKALMARFHLTSPERQYEVTQQFSDDRLSELGIRIVYGTDVNHVGDDDRARYHAFLQVRHHGEGDVGWRTVSAALTEIDDLERENPEDAAEFNRLREYIVSIGVDAA